MNTCFKYYLNIILILILMNLAYPQDSIENVSVDKSTSLTYGVENDFVTRYIWHGLSFNHGIIHQPTVWLTYSDFTLYTWASLTQHEFDKNTIYNEVDLAVQYSKRLWDFNLETSLTYIYALQADAPATTEAFLKIGYEAFETELFADVTLDIMEYSGSFSGNFGVNNNLYENDELSICAGLNIGWANRLFNENYLGVSENIKSFNYSTMSVEATYYVFDNFYIKPHIEYCYLFSLPYKIVSGNSLINFGLAVGMEF